jgi:hypothetical protein
MQIPRPELEHRASERHRLVAAPERETVDTNALEIEWRGEGKAAGPRPMQAGQDG